MTIIDRYLLLLFIKIFLVCFISFAGLFVVIDLFTNLDELSAMKNAIGWQRVALEFYAPRIAEMFEKTSAVWTLLAAVFTASLIQRRHEMTAMEAAGIRRIRILMPIYAFSVMIVFMGIANREWVLPRVRDNLVRSAQDWLKQDHLPMGTFVDLTTGIKIRGSEVSITQNRISKVEVQLPVYGGSAVSHIQADQGFFFPAAENQTAGIKLQGVTYPSQRENFKSEVHNGIQLFWPTDQSWLKPDECYVACHFDPYQAAYGPSLLNYQSIPEMMTELRKPRAWYGNQSQINVHARFIRPLLDMSLLLIGLPLVIQRKEKNIFVASGLCFGLVAFFVLFVLACHALGQYSILQPAALAAWLPAIVFFPMAIVSTRSIDL